VAEGRLEVHVVTPEREVWTGEADMVVAQSVEGQLGVLPGHAPLLAVLDIGPLRVVTGGGDEVRAVIEGGFFHVAFDRVDVLAEYAIPEGEIDVEGERSRREELERRLAEAGDEDREELRGELARATARLNLAESSSG
jgi:F-type H+-transporting ATPase subunit epsilon